MKTFKLTHLVLPLIVVLSAFSFSCAKKAGGVRTVRQTEGKVMNQAVNTPSVNAGNAQGLLYNITVIDRPVVGDSEETSFVINAEIRTPNGRFIPITTTHTAGKDVLGTYNDPETAAQLDIRARCIGTKCETYILLITVIKNNQSVHQVLGLSNSNEDFFHYENVNASVAPGYFYRTLDEVAQRKGL